MQALADLEILLASKSPRRQQLLQEMGLNFRIVHQDIKEDFPSNLPVREVAKYLAALKAEAVKKELKASNQVILASDTTVVLGDRIFNKAADAAEAASFLRALSGKVHEVITAVCLLHQGGEIQLSNNTKVHFMELSEAEIDYYIENCQPFDKAGAYAIQEWIGLNKIEKIEGSYFNVVGLPTQAVYAALLELSQAL